MRLRPLVLPASALGAVVGVCVCFAATARAQSYEGQWRAGNTRIDVQIESWGSDCGPRPQSMNAGGGGVVQVTQQGDHLQFRGSRTARTDGCWSENNAVQRVSTSASAGQWRTICRTREGDPRSETGTYTLRAATPDRLEFRDVSRYDWELNASHCTATITSTQSFDRVGGAQPTPTPTPTPTPPPTNVEVPEPPEPRCTPGAAARISMRPAERAEIEPGGRTCFRARVVDAANCALPGQTVTWTLAAPAGSTGELRDGCFRAADTAAAAEGTFRLTATSGALSGEAVVVVRTQDLSDLIARRAGGAVGAMSDEEVEAQAQEAARVGARNLPAQRSSGALPWVIASGAALVLIALALGIALVLRGRGKPRAKSSVIELDSDAPPAPGRASMPVATAHPPANPEGPKKTCPVCKNEFASDVGFCPNDGAQLVAPSTPAAAQALICPTCRRGFPAETRFCPHDGDEVIRYAMFQASHRQKEEGAGQKTHICPKCGERYPRTTTFCGRDGSPLVLVN